MPRQPNYLAMKFSFAACAALLFLIAEAFAQDADGIRESDAGKIFFTDTRIASEAIKRTDFLDRYTLTHKSNLFFVAYFRKPLSDYRQQLAPSIASDSLFKIGNFQFSMSVDGKEIYTSELLPGAPNLKIQSGTTLNRPLIDNIDGQGSWSESFWNRFLKNGGSAALTDGKHRLRMEIRAYVKTDKLRVGELMASGELDVVVSLAGKPDASNVTLHKVTPYDGFPVSAETFDENRIKQLKAAIDEGIFKKINAVIVVKHGKLLIEEYFNGESRNSLHDPRSVGKSFASTLTGIAIADGYLKSEKQTLNDFYPMQQFAHFSAEKQHATLEELLVMSSGFDADDDDYASAGNEEKMYEQPDWVKFALDLPYSAHRKNKWHYCTAGVVLLGDIIDKSVPPGLEKYADEKLFAPLGIRTYTWQYTPQNVPNTAGGIQMCALDFAKYGQLYKNSGIWNGHRILNQDWIAKTFEKQRQIGGRDNEYYGYLFWNKTFGNQRREAFYCAGNGGNYIIVFKDIPYVIVITASAYGQPYAHSQVSQMLSDYILPAIGE